MEYSLVGGSLVRLVEYSLVGTVELVWLARLRWNIGWNSLGGTILSWDGWLN